MTKHCSDSKRVKAGLATREAIAKLKDQGLSTVEIAERTGFARNYVYRVLLNLRTSTKDASIEVEAAGPKTAAAVEASEVDRDNARLRFMQRDCRAHLVDLHAAYIGVGLPRPEMVV